MKSHFDFIFLFYKWICLFGVIWNKMDTIIKWFLKFNIPTNLFGWLLIPSIIISLFLKKRFHLGYFFKVNPKPFSFDFSFEKLWKSTQFYYWTWIPLSKGSYLVDPASSHMLVIKIKPCRCKYKLLLTKLRTAHYNSYNLLDRKLLLG